MPKRRRNQDLAPYLGCDADQWLGLDPLGVGWLDGRPDYAQGKSPADFVRRLAHFCDLPNVVCRIRAVRPCPLCKERIAAQRVDQYQLAFGSAEIRVIGQDDIYAAPDLIYHFVTAHNYLPPAEFVDAVRKGPQPNSAEYRALIRTLQQAD